MAESHGAAQYRSSAEVHLTRFQNDSFVQGLTTAAVVLSCKNPEQNSVPRDLHWRAPWSITLSVLVGGYSAVAALVTPPCLRRGKRGPAPAMAPALTCRRAS